MNQSSQITCVIIDDEEHCLGALKILIASHCPYLQLLACYTNGIDAIEGILKKKPDLIFLDIAMPRMNGFEMLSKIKNPAFEIIFTTAYDQYAIKAFKVSAIDYLLKPIDKFELQTAVSKVKKRLLQNSGEISEDSVNVKLEVLLKKIRSIDQHHMLSISTMDGIERIKSDDIFYFESDGNYSKIYFDKSNFILTTKTIGEYEVLLSDSDFIRIHRSYLINLTHLKKYVRGDPGSVILENDQELRVSRRKKRSTIKDA